jgi:hypothetical protein
MMTFAVAAASFLLSILTTVVIVSYRFGILREQVNELRLRQSDMATRNDLTPIKESLAEIKGMFRLELKDKG